MKKTFIALTAILLAIISPVSGMSQTAEKLFQYPVVPDSKVTLTERCNYLVDHFWDRCNIKQSFSTLSKLEESFGDWLDFMPYADADTVHMAIDRYIAAVKKTGASNVLAMGRMAERWLYNDTAAYASEELYLPFCRAVVETKKIPSAERARFEAQYKILSHTQVGMRAPDFEFIDREGKKHNFSEVLAPNIIIFFNDPDCMDCMLAKARLSADFNTQQLVDKDIIKIVSIYPGEADAAWKHDTATYPADWVVGAAPDVDEYFALNDLPIYYYLNSRHKIIGKNLLLDNLLLAIRQLNAKQQAQAGTQAGEEPAEETPSENQ